MKQSLDLRQSQKLAMTPQLQQAIRLLQMSTSELSLEIQHAHETNPLLELGEEVDRIEERVDQGGVEGELSGPDYSDAGQNQPEEPVETASADDATQLEFDQLTAERDVASWEDMQSYLPVDQRRQSASDQNAGDFASLQGNIPEEPITLKEVLANQAIYLFTDENDRRIAHHVIQYVDDGGYLEVELEEVEQSLAIRNPVEMRDIERVLRELQTLEPTGVFARNPAECLTLQLDAGYTDHPDYQIARQIIESHLGQLANREYVQIRKMLNVSDRQLAKGVELIRQLNPHPGFSVGNSNVDFVVPDVIVEKRKGNWCAVLNQRALPRLAINQDYQRLISQSRDSQFGDLKEQLQHARWLLSNLEKRHQTVHSVASEIVHRQQEFFDSGAERMKPMTLSDIAEPLGVHESTVSRATSGKYLSAPQGVFELKYFFSSHLNSTSGEAISSLAIHSEIRNIVAAENPGKPVSDEKMCEILARKGFSVARRTVAKYREQMNIPASSKRKSL